VALISAIVVNYNNADVLEGALTSLAGASDSLLEIIVVDNASTDRSAEVGRSFGASVTWIQSETNSGYSAAVNRGAATAKGDYLAILNNDVITDALTLERLVARLEELDGVVMIAPRLLLNNGDTQWTCRELPSVAGELADLVGLSRVLPEGAGGYLLGRWAHRSSRMVQQAAGAALVLPRQLFREINGFDERYPLYFEDVDFCRRVGDHGHIYFDHDITMNHVAEATATVFRSRTTKAIALGRYRYFRYNHSRVTAEFVRVLGILRALSRGIVLGLRFALSRRQDDQAKSRAYFAAVRLLAWKPLAYNPLED